MFASAPLYSPWYDACREANAQAWLLGRSEGSPALQGVTEQPRPHASCVKHDPVLFHKPGISTSPRDTEPTRYCLPVSVLDGQVLLHTFHQVPEALGKALLLGERLAIDQARPQFTEILLGDMAGVRALALTWGLRRGLGKGLDRLPDAPAPDSQESACPSPVCTVSLCRKWKQQMPSYAQLALSFLVKTSCYNCSIVTGQLKLTESSPPLWGLGTRKSSWLSSLPAMERLGEEVPLRLTGGRTDAQGTRWATEGQAQVPSSSRLQ